jgi:hypothetical protein
MKEKSEFKIKILIAGFRARKDEKTIFKDHNQGRISHVVIYAHQIRLCSKKQIIVNLVSHLKF